MPQQQLIETPIEDSGRTLGAYDHLRAMIAEQRCILLDGAMGTELIAVDGSRPEIEEHLWGVSCVVEAPEAVRAAHRGYVDAGSDVVSTNTWGLPTAIRERRSLAATTTAPVHWMDVARDAVRLAREAAADGGRSDEIAVAFSLNADIDVGSHDGEETIRLLLRALHDAPPDLILLETLSIVHPHTYRTLAQLRSTGLPFCPSFRRCRRGLCGVYGEHWGGPEGDEFGRAARRFEAGGAGALLINCIPPDHVTGMVSWLRDFTDLPLGVYPNLGHLSTAGWRNAHDIGPEAYAALASEWREEGAQIIGGCCGVGPAHIASAHAALTGTRPGRARPRPPASGDDHPATPSTGWHDRRGRRLYPLPFPRLVIDDGVAAPTQTGLMLWRHLQRERIGAGQRCLDVGSGTGLLALQLALNGAEHVHALDILPAAVANTITNASLNDAADRVTAQQTDIYPWVADERYDVIVANLDQAPADPRSGPVSHRPNDFWGRNLVDHVLELIAEALDEDGLALVVHLSTISQQHTNRLLAWLGLDCAVADYTLLPVHARSDDDREQIERVKAMSDAYEIGIGGGSDLTVAYLLEITHRTAEEPTP